MSTSIALLSTEQALTHRILSSSTVPANLWQRLAGKSRIISNTVSQTRWPVEPKLAEIIDPMLCDLQPTERARCESAAQTIGLAFEFISRSSRNWTFGNQLLAACLMPLYRSLATGEIYEAIQLTYVGLSESLVLVCLSSELGPDLITILERSIVQNKSPRIALQEKLDVRLEEVARQILCVAGRWDSEDPVQLAKLFECETVAKESTRSLAWAHPELIWRLAGELLSKKAEFILPREWINVPVPWNSVIDNWMSIESTLSNHCREADREAKSDRASNDQPAECQTRMQAQGSTKNCGTVVRVSSSPAIECEPLGLDSPRLAGRSQVVENPLQDDSASRSDIRSNAFDSADTCEGQASDEANDVEPVVAKVIMAEVLSHNDPAFTNLLSRQLSTCRAEDRSVCLMAIRVEPEEEQDRQQFQSSRTNGLALWQQRLVNWLADHPDVHEPYAFVSMNGELILCLMDLERNCATSLLRQGLIEVLTGKRLADESTVSLSRVHVPARYHAGIASVSSPSASLAIEQLIGATYRCLEAAQRQGRAAIKSIEVFA